MPTNDNWNVSIVRDRSTENSWIATAKRDDFEFSQKVQANEGEITQFCQTARAMYAEHVKDLARSKELEDHFDEILEREDKREAEEYAAAVAAAAQAIKDADAAKAKADADAKAAADAAAAQPAPVVDAPVEAPAAEPIQDAPQPEEPNNETTV